MKKSIWVFFLLGQYGIQKDTVSTVSSTWPFLPGDSTPPQVTPDALGYDALVMGRKEPMRETDGSGGVVFQFGGVAGVPPPNK